MPAPTTSTLLSEAESMLGLGIVYGLVVLVAALLFAFGLTGEQNRILIGVGLLLLALCAILGTQPDWPVKRRDLD
jgi:Zn-dependent protease with chaperone function